MGYRLTVEKVGKDKPSYYGTKLYGYCEEEKLESYQWLIKNGYLDKDKYYSWSYGSDIAILMRAEDFREFAKLYEEDLNKYYEYEKYDSTFIGDPDIQEFMSLDDWELIVISWG